MNELGPKFDGDGGRACGPVGVRREDTSADSIACLDDGDTQAGARKNAAGRKSRYTRTQDRDVIVQFALLLASCRHRRRSYPGNTTNLPCQYLGYRMIPKLATLTQFDR
jgi:hypothetical protein